MIESYPYTTIVLCLGLIVYIWTMFRVGAARARFQIPAPAMDGPVEFQRTLRVHGNTLEQIVIFGPALVLFAAAWGDSPAALVGALWPIGRVIYAISYAAGANRSLGFGLAFISSVILLAGTLAGAIMKVV